MVAAALVAPFAGRLANWVSTAWLCVAGGVCLAIGLLAAALLPLQSHHQLLAPLTLLCGLGFGLFQVPNNRNMFLAAPLERSGAAGGMQGTARLSGQTSGAIMMTLLFTVTSIDTAPRIGLGVAAVFALASGIVSAQRTRLIGNKEGQPGPLRVRPRFAEKRLAKIAPIGSSRLVWSAEPQEPNTRFRR